MFVSMFFYTKERNIINSMSMSCISNYMNYISANEWRQISRYLSLQNCYLWSPYRELCCYLDKGTVIEPFSCRILLTFRSKCVLRLTTIIYGIEKFEFYLKDWVQCDRKNISWFAMVYDLHLNRCVFNPQVKGLGMKNRKIPNHQRF